MSKSWTIFKLLRLKIRLQYLFIHIYIIVENGTIINFDNLTKQIAKIQYGSIRLYISSGTTFRCTYMSVATRKQAKEIKENCTIA